MSEKYPWPGDSIAPIPAKSTTALLIIHSQYGYRDASAWGDGASNPSYEKNISDLIAKLRSIFAATPQGQRPVIIHVQFKTVWTDSPLFTGKVGPYGVKGEEKRAIDFLECSVPLVQRPEGPVFVYTFDELDGPPPPPKPDDPPRPPSNEIIMTSHGHSVFINTPLELLLNKKGIKTLLITGIPTDHAVSTAVRSAQNLALTGKWGGRGNMEDTAFSSLWTDGAGVYGYMGKIQDGDQESQSELVVDMPRIILVDDATRTFGKGGVDAETVHRAHIESLKEFAEVRSTSEVIGALS
ncbi:isochorismatase family domain-containing [Trichoderma arundinaceum]|uniref:Isochorismatase family domain-containing n=1 Tax=Trichoderma arundinaceum TaxID=490622 RepID=A0A395NDW5_TRIAR|nr:isochorismatase family domain-containing [Trichoderma arundinaceum]